MRQGVVALVGAGPGDPGLLTVRGRWWLRRAEVVVYDRLIEPRLLAEAPRQAQRIFAGKGPRCHLLPQAEINQLLIRHARRGRRVVRLKGGDPFVFGRGGEEAQALAAARIAFEVVPGVSSAVAVPAYAGIPLTHRGLASSFAVVTGHPAGEAGRVEWSRLATAVDTLVVLMGAAALPRIAQALLAAGRAPDTPVAVIGLGTTRRQTLVRGSLADMACRVETLDPPVTIVIGDVVSLAPRLAWFSAGHDLGRRSSAGIYPPRYARRTWSLPRRSAARPSRTMRPVSIT